MQKNTAELGETSAMRLLFFLLVLCAPAGAEDTVAAAKKRLNGWLSRMTRIESKAKAIEPMIVPLATRTRAQDAEMVRRIEFLDNLLNKEVRPLGREVRSYTLCPAQLRQERQAVLDAQDALEVWVDAKLSLQNAGAKNPGLETLRRLEPESWAAFNKAQKAAAQALK